MLLAVTINLELIVIERLVETIIFKLTVNKQLIAAVTSKLIIKCFKSAVAS